MHIYAVRITRLFYRSRPFCNFTKWQSRTLFSPKNFENSASPRKLQTKNHTNGETQWKAIITGFLPIGLCLIAVMQWRAFRKRQNESIATQWEINCYCMLPLRTVSRCWGWLAEINLPEFLRSPIYKLYSNTFGVNISEALNEDFKSYPSLADFFARSLKEGVRHVDYSSCLVSPCDGTVLHYGTVDGEQIEQVKGVTYSLRDFLGETSAKQVDNVRGDLRTSLLHNAQHNRLYQCVIYLAPGDYHRFHSPAEWKPKQRRHFTGQLLSVNPSIAKWLPGLFCLNERAVYLGEWEHGFFSYSAVGATNVGTVKVYFDTALRTNNRKTSSKEQNFGNSVHLKKGQLIGEFRMGSTLVLIFEAPYDFKFSVLPGDKVKMGQRLGCIQTHKFVDMINLERSSTESTKTVS